MRIKSSLLAASVLLAGTSQAEISKNMDMKFDGSRFNNIDIYAHGELYYNNYIQKDGQNLYENKDGVIHHNVYLSFGQIFSKKLRLFSKVKIKHIIMGDDASGEIKLEKIYLQYDFDENIKITGGLLSAPIGMIKDDFHKSSTFYGVTRNAITKNIISSGEWQKAGIIFSGKMDGGFRYDLAVTGGPLILSLDKTHDDNLNKKVTETKIRSHIYTSRIEWTGIDGFELAATMQYEDNSDSISTAIFETHAVIKRDKFGLSALYADSHGKNREISASKNSDKKNGWYLEPSYKISEKISVFTRYNRWKDSPGGSLYSRYKQIDFGVNIRINENLLVKAGFQNGSSPAGKYEHDGFSLGVNYRFENI